MENQEYSNSSKWVSAKVACEILNIGRTKLYHLCKDHELKYSKPGKQVYVLKKSIDEYLDRYASSFDIEKAE